MGRKKVIRLNGDDYSKLFRDFSDFFLNDFPDDFDTWELLAFSMEAWNTANINRLMSEDQFIKTENLPKELGETNELFKKMIEHKEKHYSHYDKFILNFDMDYALDPPKLKVSSGNFDDFKMFLEENEVDEELEEDVVNRNAIILKPKEIFVNWAKNFFQEDNVIISEAKIYLVNDEELDPEDWLEGNFDTLFVRELEDLFLDEADWPQNRTYSMFRKWFEVDFSMMVYDLENTEIIKSFF